MRKIATLAALVILALGFSAPALANHIPDPNRVNCQGGPCNGTDGEDLMIGSDQVDAISAFGADDTAFGNEGDDDISGGAEDDLLGGGPGRDTINGGTGHDDLRGGIYGDTINGSWGQDTLTGDGGPDTLIGYGDKDHVDTINCGSGNDTVRKGVGDRVASNCETVIAGADWQMNETSGPMIDSSGNGHNGDPTDVRRTGSKYVFNGSTSHVVVPDDDGLDPLEKDITLRARVKVTDAPMDDDSYDVVRKGLSGRPGGQYKMEIKSSRSDPTVGKLNCLFQGSEGTVNKVAQRDIVDGNWHTLECIKTSTSVVARVDGRRGSTKTGSVGSVSNPTNVLVGAKTAAPLLDDVFDGKMDFVSIDITR
jgi:concanavalin A-like lectin/glucanase superfamily protein/hemolysin type calcium-binding protein